MRVPETRLHTNVEFTVVENESIAEINRVFLNSCLVVVRQITADSALLVPYLPERDTRDTTLLW